MTPDELSQLFDTSVAVSVGEVDSLGVAELHRLSLDEIPPGFERWAEKRQREFRSGRHHAKAALSEMGAAGSDMGATAAVITRDEDGVPLFPSGYCGSITHTGRQSTFAAAVVCREPVRVGIDAEEVRDLPEDMVQYILSENERRELIRFGSAQASPFQSMGTVALLAFSAKEAFYKCIFPLVRCRLGFHEVHFLLDDVRSPALGRGSFRLELLRKDVEGAPLSLPGHYMSSERHVVCGVTWASDTFIRG